MNFIHQTYYLLKPLIPRAFQLFLRRLRIFFKKKKYEAVWPINECAGNPPDGWQGWPENKKFALVLTHDVDTSCGQDKSIGLMNLEKHLGFKSTFFFVPEDYVVSYETMQELKNNGFEVGIHGLTHDGKLYQSKKIFNKKAAKINRYMETWQVSGFRSPCMQHNLEWISELNIAYDASTYDIDPFEPQGGGMSTIFPFVVKNKFSGKSYIELPYTLPQDFLLFILLKEKTIDIWKRKLDWIVQKGGMALLITHPDYMVFNNKSTAAETYPAELYREFLQYLKGRYEGQYWQALCWEVGQFYALRTQGNGVKE